MDKILENCKLIHDRSPRPFGIAQVQLDEDGKPSDVTIEYLNSAMAATADGKPSDFQGRNIYEIWPDGDHSWLDNFYHAAYLDESVEFETTAIQYRTFQSVTIFPITEGYCGYEVQDMTLWMAHFRSTMENVSAGMFFYEPRTQFLLLTEPARECCNLDTECISAKEFAYGLFDDGAAKRVYESFVDYPSEYDKVLCEERMLNGNWIILSMSHAAPSERFSIGLLEDITVLRETEARSDRYFEIIESLSSEYYGLRVIDLDLDRTAPYTPRHEVAEYFAEDIESEASYSKWLKIYCDRYVAEADRQKVFSQLNRESLLNQISENCGEFSISCKRLFGDEEQYIEIRIIKISDSSNVVVLAARNINEVVRQQIDQKEAIQSALTLAEHASEAKTTFLTNISHDFRTPLNSINGFANLALSHLNEKDKVRDSLEKIVMSNEHLLDLINDILDVSRIESGKIVLNEQPINIGHLMDNIKAIFYTQSVERDVELNVDTSNITNANVMGDQLRINQILINTIGNALKYTGPSGRVDVIVSEGAIFPNGFAMFDIIVRDTGCGMSKGFIDRIFLPFERDSIGSAYASEGSGLGMAITKNLVDLIGGTITVESEVGKGSEFDISLPLRLDKRHQAKSQHLHKTGSRNSIRFDGFRALVVDDDELSREMMSEILSDRGFDVEQAADGVEAVRAVESSVKNYYDVVITDMRMPNMTGDEAARTIRSLPRDDVHDLPIIAATADAFEEGYRRSRKAGMTAHITKPINTKELISLLDEYLRPIAK